MTPETSEDMENSLAPAFVRINYTTAFGVHSMTVPSVPVFPNVGSGIWEFDLRGAEVSVPVEGAVIDFVNLLKEFHHATTQFVDYVLFTKADEDSPSTPVDSKALAIAGNFVSAAWAKAVQVTWTWRCDDFGLFKIVLLDVPNYGFDRHTVLENADQIALNAYVIDDSTWLAGRSGGKPDVFLQYSQTLNEKLRKSYRMD